eukprot:TRINITY_DN6117_c1_g1_i1.p1 TRINITY_DN6117_c1_g1~~TRINITY_DN6117_c1_g1_i1.p1  ORF type:complete len:324 (-),score=108.22 TRINITY_DN6117_c1_g1_i1:116-1087(-)
MNPLEQQTTWPNIPINYENANFPVDSEGRVYHVGAKKGEVFNRILTVGSKKRAELISKSLDVIYKRIESSRGFSIISGMKNNKKISIIATGMGIAMIDFMLREVRGITTGPIVVVRLGTCGIIDKTVSLGTVLIANQSTFIHRNPDAFLPLNDQDNNSNNNNNNNISPYTICKPVPGYKPLINQLANKYESRANECKEFDIKYSLGTNCSADTFYAAQGRFLSQFDDRNDSIISDLNEKFHDIVSLEMESFHIYHLSNCAVGEQNKIYGAACAIGIAQRDTNDFLQSDLITVIEKFSGEIILETISEFEFPNFDDDEIPNIFQ